MEYHVIDIETGEILMQSMDFNLCLECAFMIKKARDVQIAIL